MKKLISISLVIVGVINFLPIVGLLGTSSLESAYNITLTANDITILMQHRALLFGLLGGLIIYSAFVQKYQTVSIIMAGISMFGFAILVNAIGTENTAINKVLIFDYVGIFFLCVAVVLKYVAKRS